MFAGPPRSRLLEEANGEKFASSNNLDLALQIQVIGGGKKDRAVNDGQITSKVVPRSRLLEEANFASGAQTRPRSAPPNSSKLPDTPGSLLDTKNRKNMLKNAQKKEMERAKTRGRKKLYI